MNDTVHAVLGEIEADPGCRVLFAVEWGMRAWGMAASGSDYDVRFVYVHPPDLYLAIEEYPETIERYYPQDIDCAGWEARGALRLLAEGSVPMHEWLGSPIVYRKEGDLLHGMRSLAPLYFNPQKAMHHYLGAARNYYDNYLDGYAIGNSKLLCAVRPLLAAAWIGVQKTMPPVPLPQLLEAGLLPAELGREVRDALEGQAAGGGDRPIRITDRLKQWMDEALAQWVHDAHEMDTARQADREPLNELFRQVLLQ